MNENRKREPWRIIVGVMGVLFITVMWAKKDIAGHYASLPPEELTPLLITTAAVTLVKVAALSGGVLLIKWIADKLRRK